MIAPNATPDLVAARVYIEGHASDRVTMADLERISGLGRFTLVRRFKQAFGAPPFRYLRLIRLARARELLLSGMNASRVAHETGFCDLSHFIRSFKDAEGIPPGRFSRTISRSFRGDCSS